MDALAGERVDGWYEVANITAAAADGRGLASGRGNAAFAYDVTDKRAGDFSIVYRQRASRGATQMGFAAMQGLAWSVSEAARHELWLKISGQRWNGGEELRWVMRDKRGKAAYAELGAEQFAGEEWVKLEIPVRTMVGIEALDLSQISELYLNARLSDEAVVRFDDVLVRDSGQEDGILGITDKSVRQRMREARQTHPSRAAAFYRELVIDAKPPILSDYWARLWLGEDLEAVNEQLLEMLIHNRAELDKRYGFADSWHLWSTPWLIRTYNSFGPGKRATHGRLSAGVAAAILEILWQRTVDKNDIHWARARSPWYMDGSENHDLNMVVANYLSSQIFKNNPEYAARVYPNRGSGGGTGYWFHVKDGDIRFKGPYGGAELADKQDYVAEDHYNAWGEHLKEIIRERARKGFFLEQASPSYMKFSLSFLQDAYEFSEDAEMRELSRSFLDLIWASWALESLHGQRGGAKTRDHLTLAVRSDSMYTMARFLFGGDLAGGQAYYPLPAMEYELPEIAWHWALNRELLGEFAVFARAIGEEPAELPRKPGLERTLDLTTEHRMFRYSWVTPQYILGAQMDHPLALHSHLSPTSRWFGVNFANHPDARIFPYGVRQTQQGDWELVRRAGIMARNVQQENVLLSQQSRGYLQVNPEWYPQRSLRAEEFGIYISPTVDRVVERDGWIFVQSGDAYAAIRIVAGVYSAGDRPEQSADFVTYRAQESMTEPLATDTYFWSKDRTLAVSRDPFTAIVWDCSSSSHYPDLEAFIGVVLSNRIELHKTVVPGWYRLIYQGTGKAPAVLHLNLANNEIPTVNGEPLDFNSPHLFDAKYLKSDYKSGHVRMYWDGAEWSSRF